MADKSDIAYDYGMALLNKWSKGQIKKKSKGKMEYIPDDVDEFVRQAKAKGVDLENAGAAAGAAEEEEEPDDDDEEEEEEPDDEGEEGEEGPDAEEEEKMPATYRDEGENDEVYRVRVNVTQQIWMKFPEYRNDCIQYGKYIIAKHMHNATFDPEIQKCVDLIHASIN